MTPKWLGMATVIFLFLFALFWIKEKTGRHRSSETQAPMLKTPDDLWTAPDLRAVPANDSGALIRYGRELICKTGHYFGPRGIIGLRTNGMNCQNCHLDAGTRSWAGNFGAVAATYPRHSERRGTQETVYQRISDCFERSLNGESPDSNGREMKAMAAYILWLGKDVPKGKRPRGCGLESLPFMERPADTGKGMHIYLEKCQSCHGHNGYGQPDSSAGFIYPPLWGEQSYNTAAGLFRLSKLAGFIKDNMPLGSTYRNEQLTVEEAWDLAAFVNSRPRPEKSFPQDWPDIQNKPFDLADGPFADPYSSAQHKYGPYAPITGYRNKKTAAR